MALVGLDSPGGVSGKAGGRAGEPLAGLGDDRAGGNPALIDGRRCGACAALDAGREVVELAVLLPLALIAARAAAAVFASTVSATALAAAVSAAAVTVGRDMGASS